MKTNIKRNYYSNGQIECEEHYMNDKLHNENGPAKVCYYQNGKIRSESYYINGIKHREDGPQYINYFNINFKYEHYHYNDIDKENIVDISEKEVCYSMYCINNIEYTVQYQRYKNNLSERMIKTQNNIDLLKIMKIVCIENSNQKLLNLVNNKITLLESQLKLPLDL